MPTAARPSWESVGIPLDPWLCEAGFRRPCLCHGADRRGRVASSFTETYRQFVSDALATTSSSAAGPPSCVSLSPAGLPVVKLVVSDQHIEGLVAAIAARWSASTNCTSNVRLIGLRAIRAA